MTGDAAREGKRDFRDGDDPSSASTMMVGLIGVVALLVIVAALSALYYDSARAEWEAKFVAISARELTEVRAAQQAELQGYRWIDRGKGIVAVPIERAMDLVVEELSAGGPSGDGRDGAPGGTAERGETPGRRSSEADE